MQQSFINAYNENLVLKAELSKKEHMVEKKFFDEVEFFHINEWQAKLDTKDVSIAKLKKHIENLQGKNIVEKDATPNNAKVITPGMFKLDLEPLSPKELVEHARALRPLDSDLDSSCKYAKRIQEVLVYVTTTCPSLTKPSEKLVAVTPLNKTKKVRFAEPATSSSNTKKQVDSHKTQDSNKHVLPSTGMKSSTSASRKFTIDGNRCPLTRITSTNVVPPKNPLPTKVAKKTTTRRNNLEKLKDVTNISSSSCLNCSLVFGLRMLQAYDQKPLSAHQFCSHFSGYCQFCDSDLEVAFHKHTCYIRDLEVRLNATIRNIRTDNGIEFLNQTLRAYYEDVRISHQTSVARSPQQNDIVERRNQNLMEVARTMLIFLKALLFL
ncbi:retrovirus-related pol polyprotein from transposon TNT 1-94 [Tanacetum coccineum]